MSPDAGGGMLANETGIRLQGFAPYVSARPIVEARSRPAKAPFPKELTEAVRTATDGAGADIDRD